MISSDATAWLDNFYIYINPGMDILQHIIYDNDFVLVTPVSGYYEIIVIGLGQ
jgi:hypothetical protein